MYTDTAKGGLLTFYSNAKRNEFRGLDMDHSFAECSPVSAFWNGSLRSMLSPVPGYRSSTRVLLEAVQHCQAPQYSWCIGILSALVLVLVLVLDWIGLDWIGLDCTRNLL